MRIPATTTTATPGDVPAVDLSQDRAPDVPVLIVGGGPVGLFASLLLARHGVCTLLVERHPGTSLHPKARGLSVRTMELMRTCGLEEQVRAAGAALAGHAGFLWAESLAGREFHRVDPALPDDTQTRAAALSPTSGAGCTQNDFEPILLAAARRYPQTMIRFEAALVALEQDASGVQATLRDQSSGTEQVVRAQYVVAADGVHGPVRQLLGIAQQRLGETEQLLSIYFQADLTRALRGRSFIWCLVRNAVAPGLLLSANGADRWLFNIPLASAEQAAAYDAARALAAVRAAVGEPDLAAELLQVQTFTIAAAVAERYRAGRVFLAGDAAHIMPPAGAFGLNTGLQDVHNLAWKLAAVLQGWAGPGLLDSYDAERRPLGRATVQRAVRRYQVQGLSIATPPPHTGEPRGPDGAFANTLPLDLGYGYASCAVHGSRVPHAQPIPDVVPQTAEVGRRAPHLWVRDRGERRALLDLFGAGYTLLAGPDGAPWLAAGQDLDSARPLPLRCCGLSPAGRLVDEAGAWPETYGVAADGAVLVRPDGIVAWSAPDARAAGRASLARVLAEILDW